VAVNADIYIERDPWKQPLAWSLFLHFALFAFIFVYAAVSGGLGGETWGGSSSGGGAMSATLVSSASVPLPASEVQTKNIVANESKGVSKSLPRQEEKAPEAIPILEKNAKRKPQKETRSTTVAKNVPPPEPENVAPFGEGGPVSGPYGVFNAGGAKGGFSLTGGGGDFGSRYGWYVDVVRRKIAENWLKYEVDPNISTARRVYLTFDILRNGQPANVQVEQSSGVPSLDISAVRAIQRIDTFGALPGDYSGSRVSVEFWFDYRR
jgi:protein TonB